MPCFVRPLVRVGVIGALGVGAAVLIAGPHRVHALFHQAKSSVNAVIDGAIEDPVALRAQLRALEAEYPGRIAEVRGDLAELRHQIAQLEREKSVSERVVALADQDLAQYQGLIAKAEAAREGNPFAVVRVRLGDAEKPVSLDQAYAKANSLTQLQGAYASRSSDIERDLGYLGQQEERLAGLLSQLEREQADFQAQLWQLDRQVDAIGRNERMIALMESRQHSFDQSRYHAGSLDQVSGSIAKKLAEQESRLATLAQSSEAQNYVDQARTELDVVGRASRTFFRPSAPVEVGPEVIEITPGSPEACEAPGGSVALDRR